VRLQMRILCYCVEDAYRICSYHEVSRFFITKNTLKFRQASLPVSCSILTAFVVNGLHYSNFLNILLIIEGIIMQPQVVLDLYANEGSNL
jgi:hypothetical protein